MGYFLESHRTLLGVMGRFGGSYQKRGVESDLASKDDRRTVITSPSLESWEKGGSRQKSLGSQNETSGGEWPLGRGGITRGKGEKRRWSPQ